MKSRVQIILIVVLGLVGLKGMAQDQTPPYLLNGPQPIWRFVSYDSTVVTTPIIPNFSGYTNQIVRDYYIEGDYVYILISMGYPKGQDGMQLQKINKFTGETIWINAQSLFSGNTALEDYLWSSIMVNAEGNLEVIGLQDIEKQTEPYYDIKFYYICHPIKKVFDKNTGALLQKIDNQDTTKLHFAYNFALSHIYDFTHQNAFLHTVNYRYIKEDNSLIEAGLIRKIDPVTMRFDTATFEVAYDTGLKTQDLSLGFGVNFFKIGRDSMCFIFGSTNPADFTQSPSALVAEIHDFSNIDDVKKVKTIDLHPYVFFPQDEYFPLRRYVKDNYLFVGQNLVANDFSVSCNFHWLDLEGNVLFTTNNFSVGNRKYYLGDNIGVINNKAYVVGFFREGTKEGFDIIQVSQGDSSPKIASSFSYDDPTGKLLYYPWNIKVDFEDKLVLVNLKQEDDNFEIPNVGYWHNMAFHAEDLGIDLTTATTTPPSLATALTLAPNPSTGEVTVQLANATSGTLAVIDAQGKTLHREAVESSTATLHLGHLPKGSYVVQFVDKKGNTSKGVPLVLIR